MPALAAASATLLEEEEEEEEQGARGVGAVGRAVLLCIQGSPFAHPEMLQQTLVEGGFYGN